MENSYLQENQNVEMVSMAQTEYQSMKEQISELTQKVDWFMEQDRIAKHRGFAPSSEKTHEATQLSITDYDNVFNL
jgi:hypothetical protein